MVWIDGCVGIKLLLKATIWTGTSELKGINPRLIAIFLMNWMAIWRL